MAKSEKSEFEFFNALKAPDSQPFGGKWYADGSDAYANAGYVIGFQYEPAGKSQQVYFKAFITSFNETYTSDWATEQVYGRPDPIVLWKSTGRAITLAFKIPCATVAEGYENLIRLQKLIKFLYPMYTDVNKAQTVAQSPMVRMRFMNLMQNISAHQGDLNWKKYGFDSNASNGLLGIIKNISINHNLESAEGGALEHSSSPSGHRLARTGTGRHTVDPGANRSLLPKVIDVNLDFTPIHEHPLGWTKEGDNYYFGFSKASSGDTAEIPFPYGAAASVTDARTPAQLKLDQAAMAMAGVPAAAAAPDAPTPAGAQQTIDNAKGRLANLMGKMGSKIKSLGYEGDVVTRGRDDLVGAGMGMTDDVVSNRIDVYGQGDLTWDPLGAGLNPFPFTKE